MAGSNSVFQRALLAKREAVPGTLETLVAGDAVRDISDFPIIAPGFKRLDTSSKVKQHFGHDQNPAQYDAAVEFPFPVKIPVRKAPAAGSVPPDIAEFLAGACGCLETINAGVSVVYTPKTHLDVANAPATSIGAYEAGKEYMVAGVRGNFKLDASQNQRSMMSFDLKGGYATPTPDAAAPAVSPRTDQALGFAGVTVITEDGSEVGISKLGFDAGNKLESRIDSKGYHAYVVDNAPMITLDPLAVANAIEWDKILSSPTIAIVATWTGMVLSCPVCRLTDMKGTEAHGQFRRDKTYEVLGGDSAWSLTF